LSGGLDSSSIVCMVKKILEESENSQQSELKTFSFYFENFHDADERYYINKVIDTGNINSNLLPANKISPLEGIADVLNAVEEPFNYPNAAVMWNLLKKEHENNIKVVLSGEGGDSVISKGQNYFRELAVTMQWRKLFREIKGVSNVSKDEISHNREVVGFFRKRSLNTGLYIFFIKQLVFPLIPNFIKNILTSIYNRKNRIRLKPDTYFLNKEFVGRLKIDKLLKGLRKEQESAKTPKKIHNYIMNAQFHQRVLELNDRLSAPFSIEKRHPFYDKRLIEFCFAIPTEMKFQSGWDRYILRVAMEGILPQEVQWRFLKQDYLPSLQRNLFLYEKKILEETVNNTKILGEYIDMGRLVQIYHNYKSNEEVGGADSIEGIMDSVDVWLATILYIWLLENNIKS